MFGGGVEGREFCLQRQCCSKGRCSSSIKAACVCVCVCVTKLPCTHRKNHTPSHLLASVPAGTPHSLLPLPHTAHGPGSHWRAGGAWLGVCVCARQTQTTAAAAATPAADAHAEVEIAETPKNFSCSQQVLSVAACVGTQRASQQARRTSLVST